MNMKSMFKLFVFIKTLVLIKTDIAILMNWIKIHICIKSDNTFYIIAEIICISHNQRYLRKTKLFFLIKHYLSNFLLRWLYQCSSCETLLKSDNKCYCINHFSKCNVCTQLKKKDSIKDLSNYDQDLILKNSSSEKIFKCDNIIFISHVQQQQ